MLAGKFFLDSYDAWTVFGVVYESGAVGFMNYPEAKSRITRDWKDKNGLDVDTSKVYFKERYVTLTLSIYSPEGNEAKFWESYENFIFQLSSPGLHRMEFADLGGRSFFVVYDKVASGRKHTTIQNREGQGIIYQFNISVLELEPKIENRHKFLVTHDGKFIIT